MWLCLRVTGLLKRHTDHGRGIEEGSPLATMFWNVLSSMSPDEQALFLRFTYARTRLPNSDAGFSRNFKLHRMQPLRSAHPDDTLPVAHTCVFQLSLPTYSSEAVLRRQLVTASSMCVGYELDDVGTAAGDISIGADDDNDSD